MAFTYLCIYRLVHPNLKSQWLGNRGYYMTSFFLSMLGYKRNWDWNPQWTDDEERLRGEGMILEWWNESSLSLFHSIVYYNQINLTTFIIHCSLVHLFCITQTSPSSSWTNLQAPKLLRFHVSSPSMYMTRVFIISWLIVGFHLGCMKLIFPKEQNREEHCFQKGK